MCSPNGYYLFGMTLDGYLAICGDGNRVWELGPFIGKEPYAQFQRGGNFVVYNARSSSSTHKPLWDSETGNNPSSVFMVGDDGSVKIEDRNGNIIWMVERVGPPPSQAPTRTLEPSTTPSTSFNPTTSMSPTGNATYHPGELIYDDPSALFLSLGLKARVIAKSGRKIRYGNNNDSLRLFLDQPDAATCLPASGGGWHYLINSEIGGGRVANGGVGQITFNRYGDIENYEMVLEGTRMNCGGGTTPWNTFISCEEYAGNSNIPAGQCWEVHPEGKWPSRATTLGGISGGKFESAAFDNRDMMRLTGFVTHDSETGEVRRFTPDPDVLKQAVETDDYMNVLHTPGLIEYLELFPGNNTFQWVTDKAVGKANAAKYFPNTEGVDVHNGTLYFISKKIHHLFILDLDANTYTSSSTKSGAFNGGPDQIIRLMPDNVEEHKSDLLYFLEDGGPNPAGVFARDRDTKRYYTILEGGPNRSDETTGLAFCDKGKRMMVAFQDEGVVYEIVREDGLPFYGSTVNIKYHGQAD